MGVKQVFLNSVAGLLSKYLIFQTSVRLDSGSGKKLDCSHSGKQANDRAAYMWEVNF